MRTDQDDTGKALRTLPESEEMPHVGSWAETGPRVVTTLQGFSVQTQGHRLGPCISDTLWDHLLNRLP